MKRKILVLELWGLGDLTFSTVLLQGAIKEGDEVHLLGKSHAQPLLEASFPSIRFFAFEAGWTKFHRKYHLWRWNWRAFLKILWQLRKEHYDVVVSTRDDPRDHLLMALIGARKRVGFPHRGSGMFLTDPVERTHGHAQHKVEDWRDLGEVIGLPGIRDAVPWLRHDAYHSVRVETLFNDLSLPVVVLHTGARIPVRRWPAVYFEKLVARLRQEYKFHLILIPDPDGYGSELAPLADTVLNDLSMAELVDLLGRADLLLCNDSGPAHLAAACGRPTLVMFGPTSADWFRPWGNQHHLVTRSFCKFRPCFDYCRFSEPYCLTRLRPEMVWPEVRDHIQRLIGGGLLRPLPPGEKSAPIEPAAPARDFVVVITATYRRAEHLERMIGSLEPEVTPMAVLVVDNADDPATASVVERAQARMEIHRIIPGRNLSCGGGLVLGERTAFERYGDRITHLWMMDDDLCLAPGALPRMLAAMREEEAALACPMITWPNGEIGWFPGLLEKAPFDALRKRKILMPEAYFEAFGTKPVPFSWATGVSLLATREVMQELGFHRTDFKIRGEDFEFSLRISARHKAIFVPDARLTHYCFSGPFTPEAIAAERVKQIAMLHNVAYIGCRLPHGHRIFRTLPGNLWRHCKNWGIGGLPEGLLAYWRGGVLGHPAGKGAMAPQKLVVFAHTPPPHHGQSFMVKLMLEGFGGEVRGGHNGSENDGRKIACYHINARVSNDMEDIGAMRWGKVVRLLGFCAEAIWCRLRHGVTTMYYIPAPGKRFALFRDWIVMAICRPFFKHVVLHWHASGLGDWLDSARPPLERAVTQRLLGKPSLSIALAEASSRDAAWVRSRRTAIVPNGIPDPCPHFETEVLPCRKARLKERLEAARNGTGEPMIFRVFYIAHCTRDKGLFDALDGIAIFNSRALPFRVHFSVAGSFMNPAEEREFHERIRRPDLAGAVTPIGFVSGEAKARLFQESDCVCFPTYYIAESFPLTLVEAAAYGLPSVATRWRAIPEIQPPDYPGFVEIKAPEEIADALERLAVVDLAESLRARFVEKFSKESHIQNMIEAIALVNSAAP